MFSRTPYLYTLEPFKKKRKKKEKKKREKRKPVYILIQEQQQPNDSNLSIVININIRYPVFLIDIQVFINGPYGTATRAIFRAEHAVLIGAGIGVTPFASILQSIMLRCRTNQNTCPSCEHQWIGSVPEHVMRIKKVNVYCFF